MFIEGRLVILRGVGGQSYLGCIFWARLALQWALTIIANGCLIRGTRGLHAESLQRSRLRNEHTHTHTISKPVALSNPDAPDLSTTNPEPCPMPPFTRKSVRISGILISGLGCGV